MILLGLSIILAHSSKSSLLPQARILERHEAISDRLSELFGDTRLDYSANLLSFFALLSDLLDDIPELLLGPNQKSPMPLLKYESADRHGEDFMTVHKQLGPIVQGHVARALQVSDELVILITEISASLIDHLAILLKQLDDSLLLRIEIVLR